MQCFLIICGPASHASHKASHKASQASQAASHGARHASHEDMARSRQKIPSEINNINSSIKSIKEVRPPLAMDLGFSYGDEKRLEMSRVNFA